MRTGTNPYVQQRPTEQNAGAYNYRVVGDRPLHAAAAAPANSLIRQAKVAEQQGDTEAAAEAYRQALAKSPNDRRVLINFARLKHRSGDLDGSIVTYQQCLKYHPNDAVALNDLGLCYSRKNQLEQAIEHVTAAVKARPDSKRYRNNLATLFVESDRLEDSLDILSDMQGEAIGNYNVGFLLSRRNRGTEAVSYLQRALQLDPTLAPAHSLLAEVAPLGGIQIAADRPAVADEFGPLNMLPNTIAKQSGELDPTVTPQTTVYDEAMTGNVQPPEVDAYPIPGLQQ